MIVDYRDQHIAEDEFSPELEDSGARRVFETGAQRDRGTLKPRPDLISPYFLLRLGMHMAKGAEKYEARNWEKGMPVSVFIESLERHLLACKTGERGEDHLSAIGFNLQAIVHFEELAKRGDEVALSMLDEYASKNLADELRSRK